MEWTPENIRALRTTLDETQPTFAARFGLSRYQTVTEWEAGRKNPSAPVRKMLDAIAAERGFTPPKPARVKR